MSLVKTMLLFLVLTIGGCVPSLQMSRSELVACNQNEGFIFGSIQIKVVGEGAFLNSLEDSKWNVEVRKNDAGFFQKKLPPDYEIDVKAGGKEVFFVSRLEAGEYRFAEMRSQGFRPKKGRLDRVFMVEPGKSTYIGRLSVTIPGKPGFLFTRVKLEIEDGMQAALNSLRAEYGDILDAPVKRLMN